MPGPAAAALVLTRAERAQLVAASHQAGRVAVRARIVLAAAAGAGNAAIAADLGVAVGTVRTWRSRFLAQRLHGLADHPRPGRPPAASDEQIGAVVTLTLESAPAEDTHWSSRALASHLGLSQSAVSRIWRKFGVQPDRRVVCELGKEPCFSTKIRHKVRDAVGLYLDPFQRAVVLAVNPRRRHIEPPPTPPELPVRPGALAENRAMPLDYTTVEAGDQREVRHWAAEFRKFLARLDQELPWRFDVHVVLDDPALCHDPLIRHALRAHPRIGLHATPTGAAWLNLAGYWLSQPWLRETTTRKFDRDRQRHLRELDVEIRDWLVVRNHHPRPWTWIKSNTRIVDSLHFAFRFRLPLDEPWPPY
ncbi:IS630 family transposase [Amycolatopsis sp. YIM 10]|uniref:IS630 family transposase n=1 Tax=Amycolatopsis sp. YIM 10 TaxID=2653857 RepID=UPI0012900932|nr:IS630 family transposase [Amycolatopsis sp. YIM 10]QFU92553.1 hypothetical protein YIM_36970 [Amycolatopsis sp. YIM 10]